MSTDTKAICKGSEGLVEHGVSTRTVREAEAKYGRGWASHRP